MRFFASALQGLVREMHEGNQRDLVRRTGIAHGTVSKYASGRELPSPVNLQRMMSRYPQRRADLAAALLQDVLEKAGAGDMRVSLSSPTKRPLDAKTEAFIARIENRLRREPQFRAVIGQIDALG